MHGHETFCSRMQSADINDPPGDPCNGNIRSVSGLMYMQAGRSKIQRLARFLSAHLFSTRSCWYKRVSSARTRSRAACSCHWVLTACIEILEPSMRRHTPPHPCLFLLLFPTALNPLEMQCILFQGGQVLRGDLHDIRLVNAGRG